MKAIRAFFMGDADSGIRPRHMLAVFAVLWVVVFVIYLPAAKSGFVTDFTGWLDQVKNYPFREYINRTHFQARSWYQLTQFNTWVFYKLFGIHRWAWHLLFVTLHAANATLLFVIVSSLLSAGGVNKMRLIAFAGSLLFCLSPYISEVVVWEPAFHFLQGLLLVLLILCCAWQLHVTGQKKYAWCACFLYLLSTFSLEIFYITPWLVLLLAGFCYSLPGKVNARRLVKGIFWPQIIIFALRIIGYRLYAGDWVSRIGTGTVTDVNFESFGKPAKYIFHLLFLGRFFPDDLKQKVYHCCDTVWGITLFYTVVAAGLAYAVAGFRSMSGKGRVATLLVACMMLCLLLQVPLWFQSEMLVVYDRYTYFAGAFFYPLLAVLVSMIAWPYVSAAVFGLFALANLRYSVQLSRYWCKSYKVVYGLLHSIPADRQKTMILLNLPQNMHGVPMIGAEKNSEYKLMHDLLLPEQPLTNTVYDALAYNMLTPTDGAHVNVVNDSVIHVFLNQWGTWWWFETRGAHGYWTTDYKLDLKDPGHWYELTLRKPASEYMLLYSVGGEWKQVDMNKKGVDQN